MEDTRVTTKHQNDDAIERQNEGYDEAARGGKDMPPTNVGIPVEPEDRIRRDAFDREANEAANDVRRRDHSAD